MNNYSFTLNYNLLLDTLGNKKITLLSDVVNQYKYNSRSYYNYLNYDLEDNHILTEDIFNDQESPFQIFSTEIKYHHSFNPENTLITGIKYSNSTIKNSLENYDKLIDEWVINDSIEYRYEYNEKLVSTFIQYNLNRSRWSFIGGLRGEYSLGNIINVRASEEKLNIFPSLYFNYTLNDKNRLGISYTQRIQRINYLQLLPKRYYTSKYNILEGNPLLKPNIMNNVGINYNYGGKYYLTLSYRWSNNALSAFNKNEVINNKSIIVSSYVDGVKTNNINLNTYIPIQFTSWWSTLNQMNINYNNYSTYLVPKFSVFSYDLFTQHTFYLPGNIRGEILYRYLSRTKNAYSESFPYHLLNISLHKSFYNERLSVKMESYRTLYKQKMGSENHTPTALVRKETYYRKMPFFAFTISYSFSKGNSKKFQSIQYSNEQEKSRTN
ncbi:outer membrane beta-barrel family protein [Proteiniphilum sp. X52]|uniref:outer membrane beta-barrel family protein n=1 Tax=Proteiniphilum sp. X52 TaxID=2382159 RepID=UPI001314547C|nr:outer membrane beta-barrel family protein [Proteiniphilum sp. X52]